MKRYICFLIFIIILFVPFVLSQGTSVERYLKNSPTLLDYPDAAAVVLFANKDVLWRQDGKVDEDIHSFVKIFLAKGRDEFGNFKIYYRKGEQTIEIIKAGTYTEDRKFSPVLKSAVVDVTPLELSDAAIYSNVLQKVIPLPSVDVNTFLEVHLRRRTSVVKKGISGVEYFQASEPLIEKRLSVIVPQGKVLRWHVWGKGDVKLVKTPKDEMDIYSFYIKNSPKIPPEPYTPSVATFATNVVYSTYENWKDATQDFSSIYWKNIVKCNKTREFTQQLIKNVKGDKTKVEKIFEYVTRKIKNVSAPMDLTGYRPHTPDEILENRYGDRKDKVILMAAMLKSVGIESYPAFINSRFVKIDHSVPSLKVFDSIILKVDISDGEIYYLDPFAEYSTFPFCSFVKDNEALIVEKGRCQWVKTDTPFDVESNAVNHMEINFSRNGSARVKLNSLLKGSFASVFRMLFRDKKSEERDQYFNQIANSLTQGAVSKEYSFTGLDSATKNPRVEQLIDAPDLAVVQGGIMIFDLPSYPFDFATQNFYTGLKERKNPYNLGEPSVVKTTVSIKLPTGFTVLYSPKSISRETPFFSYSLDFVKTNNGKTLIVRSSKVIKKRILPPEAYKETKNFLDKINGKRYHLMLFKRVN